MPVTDMVFIVICVVNDTQISETNRLHFKYLIDTNTHVSI
jgi:hypothetical protein